MHALPMARALIADDDPDIREVLQRFLVGGGHDVVVATGGAEAIEQLTRDTYDIVVLDVEMPGVDGLAVLSATAQLPRPRPPVLMVSGLASTRDRRRGLAAGAAEYLTKPVSRCDFMVAVDRILQTSSTRSPHPDSRPPDPHPGP